MNDYPPTGTDNRSITVHVPPKTRMRGGRKIVLVPDGLPHWNPVQIRIDNKLIRALARTHRWQRLLESGEYSTLGELAAAEKIDRSYLCRMLRLTLLALDIVEAILDGQQPPGIELIRLLRGFPVEWEMQRKIWA
jgi:hypothetical protein